mmetsp:Transcript_18481/g.46491  ORF Transcript_18481/g.46491 Transcript_18481/m.46491 type:complete len:248 (+) Transcript_18481:1737-2480(+)
MCRILLLHGVDVPLCMAGGLHADKLQFFLSKPLGGHEGAVAAKDFLHHHGGRKFVELPTSVLSLPLSLLLLFDVLHDPRPLPALPTPLITLDDLDSVVAVKLSALFLLLLLLCLLADLVLLHKLLEKLLPFFNYFAPVLREVARYRQLQYLWYELQIDENVIEVDVLALSQSNEEVLYFQHAPHHRFQHHQNVPSLLRVHDVVVALLQILVHLHVLDVEECVVLEGLLFCLLFLYRVHLEEIHQVPH